MAQPVKSDQPTVLIAPSDYEHIYKADLLDKKNNHKKQAVCKIPSDQPTVLIAPSDYEHIFKGLKDDQYPAVQKIASDTPTALIAPSDFQHIYWDPKLKKSSAQKKAAQNMAKLYMNWNETMKNYNKKSSVRKTLKPQQNRAVGGRRVGFGGGGGGGGANQQEVLPQSILDLVQKFVSKQKKTYTIRRKGEAHRRKSNG